VNRKVDEYNKPCNCYKVSGMNNVLVFHLALNS